MAGIKRIYNNVERLSIEDTYEYKELIKYCCVYSSYMDNNLILRTLSGVDMVYDLFLDSKNPFEYELRVYKHTFDEFTFNDSDFIKKFNSEKYYKAKRDYRNNKIKKILE